MGPGIGVGNKLDLKDAVFGFPTELFVGIDDDVTVVLVFQSPGTIRIECKKTVFDIVVPLPSGTRCHCPTNTGSSFNNGKPAP